MDTRVVLETRYGMLEIQIYALHAPASAAAFLRLVDDGSLAIYGAFYRVVRKNDNDFGPAAIDVIQGGLRKAPVQLDRIPHESTSSSGLRHVDGTVSLARGAPGSASGATFFICIGDQPSLDAGGARSGDGEGYAAFGRLVAGWQTARKIHELPTSVDAAEHPRMQNQILDPTVRIERTLRRPAAVGIA